MTLDEDREIARAFTRAGYYGMTWRRVLILVVALAFALVRIFGDVTGDDFGSKCFKDAAHAYVCWLFCAAYYTRSRGKLVLAVVLSLVELTCFLRS